MLGRHFIHPVRMTGETALRPEVNNPKPPTVFSSDPPESLAKNKRYYEAQQQHPLAFSDAEANRNAEDEEHFRRSGALKGKEPRIVGETQVAEGRHVPYVNGVEGTGTISFRSPREGLRTWAEDVASDPGASREHKLLAEQFDLTIPVHQNMKEPLDRGVFKGGKGVASLSGEVAVQPSLLGDDEQISGSSPLPVLRPRMVHKDRVE
jgi:hypothetical protein